MSDTNPFQIIFVIIIVLSVSSGIFSIVAPSLSIKTPDPPSFPNLPDLGYQGNISAPWAFNETHAVHVYDSSYEIVIYSGFNPAKEVRFTVPSKIFTQALFVYRYGSVVIIPWWYQEPLYYMDGGKIGNLTPQIIVDSYNGTYSNFIVDMGNKDGYEAYMSISPLPGYSDMVSSWNSGHGYQIMLYGNEYSKPSWSDQIVAYLGWFGALLSYFVYFIAYMISMVGLMLTFLTFGFIPSAVGSIIIVLVTTLFIGSLLMYIRGIGHGGGK